MPTAAPITDWLNALVAHLNTEDAQTLLGVEARRAYQETIDAKAAGTHLVVLPDQWRPLACCGGIRLEQHLVNVIIQRRDAKADVTLIDEDQLLAVQVRELLTDFAAGDGRVVDVIGPLTIDQDKLQSPGVSQIQIVLDCDLLLITEAEEEEEPEGDPPEQSLLTVARAAVWNAVKNWPALDDVFARLYETDTDLAELQLRDPAASELPAIAVFWGGISPVWKWNRAQEWPMALRLSLWLPGDQHTPAERVCEDVFNALYQAKPEGSTVPYVEAATGYPPRRVGSMTLNTVTLGRVQQLRALRVDVAFTLGSNKDPHGED